MSAPFHGKYRGVVTDVRDPLRIGRIRARVPDVMGYHESGWAMPCFPFVGSGMGFFALPTEGAGVWIEFEHGDPEYPVWCGGWYGAATEVPPLLLTPPYEKVLIMTASGVSVTLDDRPGAGSIALETPSGQKFVMSPAGIEINNGLGAVIKLAGPQVTVNDGALDVT